MPAPKPDDDTRIPQDEPQVDEPTEPGTDTTGGGGRDPARDSSTVAPSAPSGSPVILAPPEPLSASGEAEEGDVVPGDIMPELDYPFHQA